LVRRSKKLDEFRLSIAETLPFVALAHFFALPAAFRIFEVTDLLGDVRKFAGCLSLVANNLLAVENLLPIRFQEVCRVAHLTFKFIERFLDELVDKLKLEVVVVCDVLNLILAVDIDAEMHVMADVDVNWLSIRVCDERRLAERASDGVQNPVRGF
jgi:hypothetical protein